MADVSEECNAGSSEEEECERPLFVVVKEEPRDYYEEEEAFELGEENAHQENVEDILQDTEEVRCEEGKLQLHECEQRDEVQLGSETQTNDFMKRVTMPGTKVILFVKRLEGTVAAGNTVNKANVTEAFNEVQVKQPLVKTADEPLVPPRRAAMDVDFSLLPPPPKPGPAPVLLPDGRIGCACGKTFSRIAWYERHGPTCALQRTFKCTVCKKVFHYKCHLRRHMESHTEDVSYLCDICGLVFTQHVLVELHRQRHSGGKPHECNLCGETFALPSHLEAHKHQHSREQPFQCETCGLCFKKQGNLHMHQRTHRKATNEKKQSKPDTHVCSRCGTSFPFASNLRRHSCRVRRRREQHPRNKPYDHVAWQRSEKQSAKEGKGHEKVAVDQECQDEDYIYLQDMEEVAYLQDVEGEQGGLEVLQEGELLQHVVGEYLQDEVTEVMMVKNNTEIEEDEKYLHDIELVFADQEGGEQGLRRGQVQRVETGKAGTQSQRRRVREEEHEEELEMEEEWIDERLELEDEDKVVDVM